MLLPGLFFIQLSMARLTYIFKGPYTLLSRGWSLCEQWGGKDTRTTPCCLQKSIPWIDRCEPWLSRRRITCDCDVGRVCLTKCWRKTRKSSSCIQPAPLAVPMQPGGPPLIMKGLNFFRGKMNRGGMLLPWALKAMVISVPLSAEVIAPSCFTPLLDTILSGTWTVVMPVSSIFHTSFGSKGWGGRSRTLARLLKNESTLNLLKLVARE